MSEIRNSAAGLGPEIRMLDDCEVDAVSGGIYNDGGCIPNPSILIHLPTPPQPFHDVFAKYTIGA